MLARSRATAALTCAAALVLGACAGAPGAQPGPGPTATATATATAEMMVDYPYYELDEMVDQASLIVEATVVSSEYVVETPTYVPGDNPEEDPLYGLSEAEKAEALANVDAFVSTAVRLRLDTVHRGDLSPGQEITIMQTGGVLDGVAYVAHGEPILEPGDGYLFFATSRPDGAFHTLAGPAGIYAVSDDGSFTATSPGPAPADHLTAADLAELLD